MTEFILRLLYNVFCGSGRRFSNSEKADDVIRIILNWGKGFAHSAFSLCYEQFERPGYACIPKRVKKKLPIFGVAGLSL